MLATGSTTRYEFKFINFTGITVRVHNVVFRLFETTVLSVWHGYSIFSSISQVKVSSFVPGSGGWRVEGGGGRSQDFSHTSTSTVYEVHCVHCVPC